MMETGAAIIKRSEIEGLIWASCVGMECVTFLASKKTCHYCALSKRST